MTKMKSCILDEVNDQHRRRKNIIISGVSEPVTGSIKERKEFDTDKVREILEEISKDDCDEIEHVHRIGRVMEGRNRIIRVVFSDEDCKDRVLREAKQLRNASEFKNVYVNPDLTFMQRR